MQTVIRAGKPSDLPAILELIRELAAYEEAAGEVEVTLEQMEQDGFGPDRIFYFFVAEVDGKVEGMALYYFKYSTWKGRCLFLEDFVVRESMRGKKLGAALFEAVIAVAKEEQVKRMEWQVLDWNKPGINFYHKYEANLDPEWLNGKLVYDQLQATNYTIPNS